MDTKIFIIGKTNTGKDTIARKLAEDFDLKVLASYTDIPKRVDQTEGVEHTFISEEEMTNILEGDDVFASYITKRGRYCSTIGQINDCDIYVINPDSLVAAYDKFPEVVANSIVIYLKTPYAIRKIRSLKRQDDIEAFLKRVKDEAREFNNFEACIDTHMKFLDVHMFDNSTDDINDVYSKVVELLKERKVIECQ